jgi:Raf kinase inhibitor-like YbhB/YbcL family protein
MKLESTAFAANGLIPAKYTCDGADISPPLGWDAPPPKTQSLALIVEDADAPGGTYTHWVLYDLPATATGLPEGVPVRGEQGKQGKNDFGNFGYGGPCPPSGTHRYFFKLYALERKLSLAPGATKEQLRSAMDRHILATAELVGRYNKKAP